MAHTYTNAVVEKSLDGEQLVVSKIVLYISQARKNSIYLYYLGLGTSTLHFLMSIYIRLLFFANLAPPIRRIKHYTFLS